MTYEALAQIIGWLAVAAFFARLLPQPLKLWRTGVPHGVSPVAVLNGLVSDLGWVLYGLGTGVLQVWLTAAVALVPCVWTAVLLRGVTTRRHVGIALVWLAVVLGTMPLGLLGAVLGVSVVVNHGPQVLLVLRQHDLRGVSAATWGLAIADATLWGCFGLLSPGVDLALVGYGTVLLTAALIVLGRVWWTSRSPLPDPEVELPAAVLEGLAYTPAP